MNSKYSRSNPEGFAENLAMLKEWQKKLGAQILFGHDMEQIRCLMGNAQESYPNT